MQQFKSQFLNILQDRGFISQITHESELDDLMSKKKITAYIGFDCTANSLHIGSLIQIMILQILQECGHQGIVLLGGGTTKIGDPSGKDESRGFLDEDKIEKNLLSIQNTLEKFDLSKENPQYLPFQFVDNDKWLGDLKYMDFLREIGRHFSINKMLTFESVKLRLDRQQPLSFLEFNYMILQGYDFYELNKNHNCRLQIGGSDQWGNIVGGVDLTRKLNYAKINNQENSSQNNNSDVFGLTTPLLTTADGKKMGKTANGAVWLDSEMLGEFDYFQYFRNVSDEDVSRFLKLFTHLSLEEILEIEKQDINQQKVILAFEATKICHGQSKADQAKQQASNMFNNQIDINLLPEIEVKFSKEELISGKKLSDILKEAEICKSGGEAKRLIKGGGVRIDDQQIIDENYLVKFNKDNLSFKLSVGKKKVFKAIVT